MDKDLRLKHFSNALFSSIYREYNTTFDLPVKLPQVFCQSEANGCSDEEKKAVLKLCVSFRSVFNSVFAKAFSHIQRSVKHFMTFLTSRCLKLCGDDLFLSFVIICAFISELNLFCCINGCYTFMSTAPRCLTAIFNRRLKREFYARGGWDRLQLFCENFVQMNRKVTEIPEANTNGDDASQHSVKNILHLLENSSSEDESESSASSGEDIVEDEEDEKVCPEKELNVLSEDEVCSETELSMSSDEEDTESSEESESSEDLELESEESGEIVMGRTEETDDESESSEESEPSSMTEEDVSESDDSQLDSACNIEQTNCLTPIMQENLSVEKKVL